MIGHIARMSCAFTPGQPDAPCNDTGGGDILLADPGVLLALGAAVVVLALVITAVVLGTRAARRRSSAAR